MLGKLLKYEWKTFSRVLFIVHGCVLLFAVCSRLFLTISGGLDYAMSDHSNDIVTLICAMIIFGIVLLVFCTAIFTYVYIGFRFYKTIFTEQGYLINTLPVTPTQLIVSKGLIGILWMVIDIILLIFACCIIFLDPAYLPDIFAAFSRVIQLASPLPAFFWVCVILILLSPFYMVLHMYFSVALGNLLANHKAFGSIVAYFISYAVLSVISTFAVGIVGFSSYSFMNVTTSEQLASIMLSLCLFSLAFTIICMIIFFIVTRYIMTKKLNLE